MQTTDFGHIDMHTFNFVSRYVYINTFKKEDLDADANPEASKTTH